MKDLWSEPTEWTPFSLRCLKASKFHNIPSLSMDTGWLWEKWVCHWCVCTCGSFHYQVCYESLFLTSVLRNSTPLLGSSSNPPLPQSLPHCPTLCIGLTIPLGLLCHAISHQSYAKSTSFTRPKVRWWLIHLCSPSASFVTTEAIMDSN